MSRFARMAIGRSRARQPPGGGGPTASITAVGGAPSASHEADAGLSLGAEAVRASGFAQQAAPSPTPSVRPRRLPWADLLRRIFGIEALRCECGKSMRVLAAITEPTVARRILECMALPSRAPPLTPTCASGSPADAWLEEPTDYDQSAPDDWQPGP
jgi:hypothetical protein